MRVDARSIPVALVLALGQSPAQQPVLVHENATEAEILEAACRVRPSPRQLAWQAHEFVAFVHFGMNTFTDREWGEGNETPTTFAPTDFDAGQWVEAFASAGMRGVVLTAKHHDGFCLWDSATTEHDVRTSGWRGGEGDVVAAVADACRERGLSFGVYLSPWDRSQKSFGTRAYHEVFQQQLRELCSGYGPLFEVWFDGAHCPADDPAVFDWQAHFRLVRELQPEAVIAITGPDVRWVGNEAGTTRAEEWSVLPLDGGGDGPFEDSREAWRALWHLRERNESRDLGSRELLRSARRLVWWPAETDVSIRPGWFHHAAEDGKVKSPEHLRDLWFTAVGGNAVLLLNVPPDRRGRVADPDAAALKALGEQLRATFARDEAERCERKVRALATEVYFGGERTFDVVDVREDVAASGQRVEAFRVDVWDGAEWREHAKGTTIGFRRLLRTPKVTARGVRVWVERARGEPRLSHVSVHRQPEPKGEKPK